MRRMGLELLDIQFQLEKRFRIKFRPGEIVARWRHRVPPDFTVGELHGLVCRKIRRLGRAVPADSLRGVREVVACALALKVEEVSDAAWLVRELGAG